jgi:hypothetical protein
MPGDGLDFSRLRSNYFVSAWFNGTGLLSPLIPAPGSALAMSEMK